MYVNVDIDFNDLLDEMTDEEVRELFDARFASQSAEELWVDIYNKRRDLSLAEFIKYIDKIIQDKTGRVLVWSI